MRTVKLIVLHVCRYLGLFRLSRLLHRNSYLVLCYHGFQTLDEASFRPKLFMTPEVFRERMEWLHRMNMRVIDLRQAIRECNEGVLKKNTISITIDDGFYSTLSEAAPAMKTYEFPSMLYVTSYYMQKQVPVFQLAVQYVFWKTDLSSEAIASAVHALSIPAVTNNITEPDSLCDAISDYGEVHCDGEESRQVLLRQLYKALQVDYDSLVAGRMLSMVSEEELWELERNGVNIQLHTHRHIFPADDYKKAAAELKKNRAALAPHCSSDLLHFCYPSGEWQQSSWRALSDFGIASAVTCESGRNSVRTPTLALKRFLDSEKVSEIEFLAEITGFYDWVRRMHRWLRG